MIAVCVRWIMLLSFAAHAALGCCIHHQHALSHCQIQKTSEPTPSHVTLVTKHRHCSCHHSHQADVPAATTTPDATPADGPVPADGCNCDEAACNFLLVDSAAGQFDSDALALSLDYIDWSAASHHISASARVAIWRTDAIQSFAPLGQLCAWQNSWQL